MKSILAMTLMTYALGASANVIDVKPTKDKVAPSRIEQVILIQEETAVKPRITLVKVDNGGSTDVSSLMQPSRVYLNVHKDGEEFDTDGSYEVLPGVLVLKASKLDAAAKTIIVEGTARNERLQKINYKAKLFVGNALKEVATGLSESVKSTVGYQNLIP